MHPQKGAFSYKIKPQKTAFFRLAVSFLFWTIKQMTIKQMFKESIDPPSKYFHPPA